MGFAALVSWSDGFGHLDFRDVLEVHFIFGFQSKFVITQKN